MEYKNQYTNDEWRKSQIDKYLSYYPDWEYVRGYVSCDKSIICLCKICKTEQELSMSSVRHKRNIVCRRCRMIEKERADYIKIRSRKSSNPKQMSFNVCKRCNTLIPTRDKLCVECRRESNSYRNTINKDRRIKLLSDSMIDKSITLKALSDRDDCVCWICKTKCDWSDYIITEQGYFVAGNNYPSIDHLMPLSKGGSHSWNNVKLSHRICNSLKGNHISPGCLENVSI